MITQRFIPKKNLERIKKLKKQKGLTYRDIAEILGRPVSTVKNVALGLVVSSEVAREIEKVLGERGLFPYLRKKEEKERKRKSAIEKAKKNLKGVK
ncbi:MAG: helix-turn-helix transcriptional regulator [Desulfurobacteriaceae bacterium]